MAIQRVESVPRLAPRKADSHKGTYGTVLVVGGARGMAGAPALAGASALRAGAGLVRVLAAAEIQPIVAGWEPSYLTYPLENDSDGHILCEPACRVLERFLPH